MPDVLPPVLDWRAHKVGAPKPCRLCGAPAIMRDADGLPCHKVCAERAAAQRAKETSQ
jgi:hypothetical protein